MKRPSFRVHLSAILTADSSHNQNLGPLGLYMLGAGVPSDHLSTTTRKTDSGGKDLSCG